jgi:predicted phage tail protein
MQALAQGVLADFDAVHRDDRKMSRNTVALRKVEQGRHQLPPGQVARAAEDDKDIWFELIVRAVFISAAFAASAAGAAAPFAAFSLRQLAVSPCC